MFPSTLSDWGIKSTPFHRDPLKELSAACQEEGIKLCFYYSIMDWHHPDYLPRKSWNDQANPNADFERYVAYMKGQLKELLTGYGPIGILWFDGNWENTWNYDRGADLYRYIRGIQPNLIVNNRVGQPEQRHGGGNDLFALRLPFTCNSRRQFRSWQDKHVTARCADRSAIQQN